MTFHIIYTPHTVKQLLFLVPSLLEYSDYHFRLVSNGCLPEEQQLLKQFCQKHKRLSFWAIPSAYMISHGHVLNYLQAMNREEYFCFMDSDIFCIDQLPYLQNRLDGNTSFFSGLPVWVKKMDVIIQDDFRHFEGIINQTSTGQCVGGTYFAIYPNQLLTEIIQETGIGFDGYRWNQLPPLVQLRLKQAMFDKDTYDTSKVVNLLLLLSGCKLQNIEMEGLGHIGGVSFELKYQMQQQATTWQKKLVQKAKKNKWIREWRVAVQNRKEQEVLKKKYKNAPISEFKLNLHQRKHQRNPVRQHFSQLYLALANQTTLPMPPETLDKEIMPKVLALREAYINIFQQSFRDTILQHRNN